MCLKNWLKKLLANRPRRPPATNFLLRPYYYSHTRRARDSPIKRRFIFCKHQMPHIKYRNFTFSRYPEQTRFYNTWSDSLFTYNIICVRSKLLMTMSGFPLTIIVLLLYLPITTAHTVDEPFFFFFYFSKQDRDYLMLVCV